MTPSSGRLGDALGCTTVQAAQGSGGKGSPHPNPLPQLTTGEREKAEASPQIIGEQPRESATTATLVVLVDVVGSKIHAALLGLPIEGEELRAAVVANIELRHEQRSRSTALDDIVGRRVKEKSPRGCSGARGEGGSAL